MTFPLNYGRMGAYGDRDKPRLAWHTLVLGSAGSLHVYQIAGGAWCFSTTFGNIYKPLAQFPTQAAAEAAAIEYARAVLCEATTALDKAQEDAHGR